VTTEIRGRRARSRVVEFRLDPDRGLAVLAVVAVVLLAASLGCQSLRHGLHVNFRGLATVQGYLNVDAEGNIPSWFQSSLLLFCAMTLWTTADDARAVADRWARHWRLLALGFGYLSVDELVALHERADEPLHLLFGTSGALLWAWVIAAIPAVVVFVLFFLSFLRALPRSTRVGLLLAGAFYVGGAIGAEMIGSYLFSTRGPDSILYDLEATVEEGMETTGMLLLLLTVGRHAALDRTPAGRPQTTIDTRAGAREPRRTARHGAR
jgi:hypothetical protein